MSTNQVLFAIVLVLHLCFVAWAMVDVWRRRPVGLSAAVAESILVWVPLLGPLAYLWLTRAPPPRDPRLKGSGVSSEFTHTMISMGPLYQQTIELLEQRLADREEAKGAPIEPDGVAGASEREADVKDRRG